MVISMIEVCVCVGGGGQGVDQQIEFIVCLS